MRFVIAIPAPPKSVRTVAEISPRQPFDMAIAESDVHTVMVRVVSLISGPRNHAKRLEGIAIVGIDNIVPYRVADIDHVRGTSTSFSYINLFLQHPKIYGLTRILVLLGMWPQSPVASMFRECAVCRNLSNL